MNTEILKQDGCQLKNSVLCRRDRVLADNNLGQYRGPEKSSYITLEIPPKMCVAKVSFS